MKSVVWGQTNVQEVWSGRAAVTPWDSPLPCWGCCWCGGVGRPVLSPHPLENSVLQAVKLGLDLGGGAGENELISFSCTKRTQMTVCQGIWLGGKNTHLPAADSSLRQVPETVLSLGCEGEELRRKHRKLPIKKNPLAGPPSPSSTMSYLLPLWMQPSDYWKSSSRSDLQLIGNHAESVGKTETVTEVPTYVCPLP